MARRRLARTRGRAKSKTLRNASYLIKLRRRLKTLYTKLQVQLRIAAGQGDVKRVQTLNHRLNRVYAAIGGGARELEHEQDWELARVGKKK